MIAFVSTPMGFVAVIVVILAVCLLVRWMVKSPKLDKFCKDIEKGITSPDISPPSTTEVIDKIGDAKKGLKKRQVDNTKEAKKLEKDSDKITGFLEDKDGKKGDSQ